MAASNVNIIVRSIAGKTKRRRRIAEANRLARQFSPWRLILMFMLRIPVDESVSAEYTRFSLVKRMRTMRMRAECAIVQ
ncbi:MAG: hypothetical protein OD918_11775 [Gammaproteobacteria bacterium]